MKTKNYSANVSIVMGKTRRADFRFGPYTRKRDLIRAMEKTLPENFKLEDGWVNVYNEYGRTENIEYISDIKNGKMYTYEHDWLYKKVTYHTYKFGK